MQSKASGRARQYEDQEDTRGPDPAQAAQHSINSAHKFTLTVIMQLGPVEVLAGMAGRSPASTQV